MKIINDFRGSIAIFEDFKKSRFYKDDFQNIQIDTNGNIDYSIKNNKLNFKYILAEMPFDFKRIFILFNVPSNIPRGDHAHIVCGQFLVCLFGKVDFEVFNGTDWNNVELVQGDTFFLKSLSWIGKIWFKNNGVLAVYCSHKFDELDYVRKIEDYKNLLK